MQKNINTSSKGKTNVHIFTFPVSLFSASQNPDQGKLPCRNVSRNSDYKQSHISSYVKLKQFQSNFIKIKWWYILKSIYMTTVIQLWNLIWNETKPWKIISGSKKFHGNRSWVFREESKVSSKIFREVRHQEDQNTKCYSVGRQSNREVAEIKGISSHLCMLLIKVWVSQSNVK